MYDPDLYDADLADVYDALYVVGVGKDYAAEAAAVTALARERNPHCASLLDVACGTGEHLAHLKGMFEHVEGVELSEPMVRIAAGKLPDLMIQMADMREFALHRSFDVVTCLFSAIGYVRGLDELHAAVRRMVAHLKPGGVLIVEPWFTPQQWQDGRVGHTVAEHEGRTVIRMAYSDRDGFTSIMRMHYLVGVPGAGVRHFTDQHVMTLFTQAQYVDALKAAGLADVELVPGWAPDRDRLVGIRP